MRRTGIKLLFFFSILCFCAMQIGCTDTTGELTGIKNDEVTDKSIDVGYTDTTSEAIQNEETGTTEENPVQQEDTITDDLDFWIGTYTFDEVFAEEGSASMFMDYEINIYKENETYFADVVIDGQLTAMNVKAQAYGDEEWISLVLVEDKPDYVQEWGGWKDNVILSMRRQGNDIYTYWGFVTPLLENVNAASGKVYLEKAEDSDGAPSEMQTAYSGEENNLDGWIGEYTFEEGTKSKYMNYHIMIYKEDNQYYGDVVINGPETDIDVKVQVYGDDEWVSLVLMEYNPDHAAGLEEMENSVLLSMRQGNEEVYTYWGERRVTQLLLKGYMTYYDSNDYFTKVTN